MTIPSIARVPSSAADAPAAEKPDAPVVRARAARLLDMLTSDQRKEYPMASGLLDYFPDALAEISHVSYLGNQKHNPGQPLHWSRAKSADHADCVVRHYTTRNGMDGGTVLHLAEAAWRALADLQMALEAKYGLAPPAGAK